MPDDPDIPPKSPREQRAGQERKPLPDSDAPPDSKAPSGSKGGHKDDAETPEVRVAGRKQMDLPPKDWDETDEESDESFPASDPPGNY